MSDLDNQQNTPTATQTSPPPVLSSANQPVGTGQKKKLGLFAVIVIALMVSVGGSAGAYYGVILPNKPDNVLRTAVTNTLSQKKAKYAGKLSFESTDKKSSIKAVDVTFKGDVDTEANAFSSSIESTASGLKLSLELRYLNKNLYLKVGDLSSFKSVVQTTAPAYLPTFQALNQKLANQWLQIDNTLLKQANTGCATDATFSLTKEDITLLEKRYEQAPFASIKSTASDTVNGRSATKFELAIDDNKSVEYGKGLANLSIIKKIKECDKNPSKTTDNNYIADNDTTPLTLWVDKSTKQIVKIAGKSTAQDEQKSKFKANFEITMQYGKASVSKPEGAKPLLEVIGDFSQLLGLGANAATKPITAQYDSADTPDAAISPACLKQIQDYSSSGGTKPVPTCL